MNWKSIEDKLALSNTKYDFYFGDYTYEDFSKGKMAKSFPFNKVGWKFDLTRPSLIDLRMTP